jgi:hypothetical protein
MEMMKKAKISKRIIIISILWILTVGVTFEAGLIPWTGTIGEVSSDLVIPDFFSLTSGLQIRENQISPYENNQYNIALQSFAATVVDGNPEVIRGVFSDKALAYPVIQQPSDQPGFVSSIDGVITQFSMAASHGVIGLLAHNYLTGKYFYDIEIGSEIQIIYGDGEIQSYLVKEIQRYQALQPNSQHSRFVDVVSGEELSASDLFKKVYLGQNHLTLQTCIEQGDLDSWGRMFIIADPI